MNWLSKAKELFSGNSIPNSDGIPSPGDFSTLMLGSPEDIIKQYISMRHKTDSLFEYADSTGQIADYGSAIMRYSAYSSVCVFGFSLYVVNDNNGVTRLIPERVNKFLYDKILFDIADFSWVMLQYCFRNKVSTNKFSEKEITNFLNLPHIPELYWTMVFSYVVSQSNADHAYKKYQGLIETLNALDPEKLDNLPSVTTKVAFEEMLKINIVGDPNEYKLFDAKHIIDVIGQGPIAISQQRDQIVNSTVYKLLEPGVQLHLVKGY